MPRESYIPAQLASSSTAESLSQQLRLQSPGVKGPVNLRASWEVLEASILPSGAADVLISRK